MKGRRPPRAGTVPHPHTRSRQEQPLRPHPPARRLRLGTVVLADRTLHEPDQTVTEIESARNRHRPRRCGRTATSEHAELLARPNPHSLRTRPTCRIKRDVSLVVLLSELVDTASRIRVDARLEA